MATKFRVEVAWRSAADGGRVRRFSGEEYRPTVWLPGAARDCEWWDVRIRFDVPGTEDPGAASMEMMNPIAPAEVIQEGMTLNLYEGDRVTATALVTAVMRSAGANGVGETYGAVADTR
jgi:hypothetical protein